MSPFTRPKPQIKDLKLNKRDIKLQKWQKIMTTSSLKWYLRVLIIEKFVLSFHSRGEADPRLCGCMNFVYKQGWSVTTNQTFEIILHKIAKIKTMKLSLSTTNMIL